MGQKTRRQKAARTLAAGLAAAVMMSGTAMTAYADEIALNVNAFPAEQVQEIESGLSTATTVAGQAQGSAAAGQPQSVSGTIVAGQTQGGVSPTAAGSAQGSGNTIVAGQAHRGTGPSIYGSIVTEGEKGYPQTEEMLGGATLTMFRAQDTSQILSAILQTGNGSLIVIDGGLGSDGDYLRTQIAARGGHVTAWLITHPHGDHVGALYRILQDEAAGANSGLSIDGIYYSFAAPEWYAAHDTRDQEMAQAIIGCFGGLPQAMLHTVGRGQTIQVDDVTIEVMNDRYDIGSDSGNNASIVYKLTVNGKKILFLGDMSELGGDRLLAEVGAEALKADIVQMAHHGQHGVSEAVYQAINPAVCLWAAPEWLWNSTSSKYTIQETKRWMNKLNVERHYCMKDGDQVIR